VVLVHAGGSGAGALVLQYCKAIGAHGIAVVSTEEKAEAARASGAKEVIVTSRGPWEEQARGLSAPIDVIYDSVGTTLPGSLATVRERGHVVFYGWAGGPAPSVDPRYLMDRSLRLSGGDLWSFIGKSSELRARAARVFEDLKSGALTLRIDREFPLSEAAKAHEYLESRKARGKVLLLPEVK
jgi:NADPH2:quinone reductase